MTETTIINQLQMEDVLNRKKLRRRVRSGQVCTACDQCYRCKVKCSAEKPTCEKCQKNKSPCTYSTGKPLGKPKGSRNKVSSSKFSQASEFAAVSTAPSSRSSSLAQQYLEDDMSKMDVTEFSTSPWKVTSHKPTTPISNRPSTLFMSNHTGLVDSSAGELRSMVPPTMQNTFTIHPTQQRMENAEIFQNGSGNTPVLFTHTALQNGGLNWITSPSGNLFIPNSPNSEKMNMNGWIPPQSNIVNHPITANNSVEIAMARYMTSMHAKTPCLCDPVALGIISELQLAQQTELRLDMALLLARRGFSFVSGCLACATCRSSSSPLFFACILIMQQIFACYGILRVQGLKMLGSSSLGINVRGHQLSMGVGEFIVRDEEGCFSILNAIIKIEMERSKLILGGLEIWAEKSKAGQQKMAKLLLRTLRDELGC